MKTIVRFLGVLVVSVLASACSEKEKLASAGTCAELPLPGDLAAGRWSERFVPPGLGGPDGYGPRVHDLAIDAEGGLVAVGYFGFSGRKPSPAAARWNGADWEPLVPAWEEIPPHFSALAIRDDGAIALTTHDAVGGVGEVYLVRAGEAERIGAFDGAIRKLLWQGDRLWMAGLFWLEDDGPAFLATWDGESWSGPAGGGADMPVFEIVEDEGSIVVAGEFSEIGGIEASRMASWDGAAWTANDLPYLGRVYALSKDETGAWIAAGHLIEEESSFGGIAHQLEDGSWELLGGGFTNGFYPGVITAMAWHEEALYVAGCFSQDANEETIPPVARWDGTRWEAAVESRGVIRPWFDPGYCGDEGSGTIFETEHQRMVTHGETLYLGGAFGGVGDTVSLGVVAHEAGAWSPIGRGGGDAVMGLINRMEVGGPACRPYASGSVSHIASKPNASALLRWVDGWEPFGPPAPAGLECTAHAVSADERVFVGCRVRSEDLEGPGVGQLFELTADAWTPRGELPPGLVFDLAFDDAETLWIAGGFGETGYLARWRPKTGLEIVDQSFHGALTRLAVEPGAAEPEVVVAGFFGGRDGVPVPSVARFDGAAWRPMGGALETVTALAWSSLGIFLSTESGSPDDGFDVLPNAADGRSEFVLARWTGDRWEELGTEGSGLPPAGEVAFTFRDLVPVRDGLVAVGDVETKVGARHAYLWNGGRFVGIGGGLGSIGLDTAAVSPEGIFFGGMIATVDPNGDARPSVGTALFEWR